ncbi:fructoselysine 6-kinase, partial [Cronobacter sakazakii]
TQLTPTPCHSSINALIIIRTFSTTSGSIHASYGALLSSTPLRHRPTASA